MLSEADIRAFVAGSYGRTVAAVALVSGSYAAAEDTVQEALLRAWERSRRGEQIDSLPAWVATVALNLSRSGLRRAIAERKTRGRLRAAVVPPPSPDRIDVTRAVAQLPRRQRETVVLRYLLDMTTTEVAEVLGVNVGTVKSQLARARQALAVELRTEEEGVSTYGQA